MGFARRSRLISVASASRAARAMRASKTGAPPRPSREKLESFPIGRWTRLNRKRIAKEPLKVVDHHPRFHSVDARRSAQHRIGLGHGVCHQATFGPHLGDGRPDDGVKAVVDDAARHQYRAVRNGHRRIRSSSSRMSSGPCSGMPSSTERMPSGPRRTFACRGAGVSVSLSPSSSISTSSPPRRFRALRRSFGTTILPALSMVVLIPSIIPSAFPVAVVSIRSIAIPRL